MTTKEIEQLRAKGAETVNGWVKDWNKFAYDALGSRLDKQQQEILTSVQFNPRTSVASGTARGKDYVAAVASVCFMYLTPKWNAKGDMIGNTKVALTAPTDRQVKNICMPEISRLWHKAKKQGIVLPGRMNVYDIRTDYEEWFLTGFKADEHSHESWSGFHAVNTMFVVTEATGIGDGTFGAIEGNLQGNSRILLVFNPNVTIGYAAESQRGSRWSKFRLSSLDAPNVLSHKQLIPGQVDYDWVLDKLETWCVKIHEGEVDVIQDDFVFEGQWYRPEDIFRVKVLGKFPKVSEDVLIPEVWVELAQQRWLDYHEREGYRNIYYAPLRLGVDVAGMGRDKSVFCKRFNNIVAGFDSSNSGGKADHMQIAGKVVNYLNTERGDSAFIDTIGEGAGVYSRLVEQGYINFAFSCKYSSKAKDTHDRPLTDVTGEYTFYNMRAYLFWAVRDFLDPKNGFEPMLPPSDEFKKEASSIKWFVKSDGSRMIEPKEDIKKRLGRSTDEFDSLANTFHPNYNFVGQDLTGL